MQYFWENYKNPQDERNEFINNFLKISEENDKEQSLKNTKRSQIAALKKYSKDGQEPKPLGRTHQQASHETNQSAKQSAKKIASDEESIQKKRKTYSVKSSTIFVLILVHGEDSQCLTHVYVPLDHPKFYKPLRKLMVKSNTNEWKFSSSKISVHMKCDFKAAWSELQKYFQKGCGEDFTQDEDDVTDTLEQLKNMKKRKRECVFVDKKNDTFGDDFDVESDKDDEDGENDRNDNGENDCKYGLREYFNVHGYDDFICDRSHANNMLFTNKSQPRHTQSVNAEDSALKIFSNQTRAFLLDDVKKIGYSIQVAMNKKWFPSYYIRMEV